MPWDARIEDWTVAVKLTLTLYADTTKVQPQLCGAFHLDILSDKAPTLLQRVPGARQLEIVDGDAQHELKFIVPKQNGQAWVGSNPAFMRNLLQPLPHNCRR